MQLGLAALAPERTNASYINVVATAAQYADLVAIQRAPPWEDFLPGGSLSAQTEDTTALETALLDQYGDLDLVYAIDPTDPAVFRERIAGLPPGVSAADGFASAELREAFLGYVTYVISHYQPDYLVLGVEINMLYERDLAQFEAFVDLYHEAYRLAKAARPQMRVFPTFQLEDLEGTLETSHSPHWEVVDPFRGAMDVLAVSTYPYLAEQVIAARDIRADYFAQLVDRFEGETMVLGTAYPSAPVEGERVAGTEEDQAAYLARVLEDAEEHGIGTVVWAVPFDPAWATSGAARTIQNAGLRRIDGANKLAWTTWEQWANRVRAEVG